MLLSVCCRLPLAMLWVAGVVATAGCTSWCEYLHNRFKVGPDYCRPDAPVAQQWLDADDAQVNTAPVDLCHWWSIFDDPTLEELIETAVRQNLSLRQAGYRVLQARAARAVAAGNLFPQHQDTVGGYSRNALSKASGNREQLDSQFFDEFDVGFNLSWELDFWGRFRRAVQAADADLDASVANYGQAMVTMLGDIATAYTEIRTLDRQIELARANADLQRETFKIAKARFDGGQVSELDVDQAASTLAQTEALIPQLQLQKRQAANRLCVLLAIPPEDLDARLGKQPIPSAPEEATVGIPADLLRRRPDVRRAERLVAAQSARVGIATSELYPHICITGSIGYSAEYASELFTSPAFEGTVGPSFQWNILNYGRLLNKIREQDAKLAELIASYQLTVLQANSEAENGIARFLRGRQRAEWLAKSVDASQRAAKVAMAQYKAGLIDFNWVTLVEQNLVQQQNLLAQAQGEVVLGLVATYRALGGGW